MKLQIRRAALCAALVAGILSSPAAAPSPNIVISQVYGGGGNSGANYTHDFIELFNRGNAAVSLGGMSLQYTSATGTGNFGSSATQLTELPTVTLQPGQYFLVQESQGTGGTTPLPAPDVVDSSPIAMAATAGKVVLVTGPATLGCNGGSTPCSADQLARIVDLVGFGGANFFETAPTPALTNTTAAVRVDNGCTDTDDNSADFVVGPPAPRNSLSPANPCDGAPALSIADVTVTEGNSGTVTASFSVRLNSPAPAGGVTFDIATADDTATAGTDYDARSVIPATIAAGADTYTFDVTVNGDTDVESHETFFVSVTNVAGADLADGTATGTITNDDNPPVVFDVVISQVYGGGGNSGATLTHDFVELFNRGASPVTLTGWSVQYTSASGTGTWLVTPLSGTIAPGGYYLIQQARGAGGTTALPTPDLTGTTALGGTSGKVALRTNSTPITGACPSGVDLVDLVGYGVTTCHEGNGPTAPLGNTTAALRKRGGCVDSNDNNADFTVGSPLPRNSAVAPRTCGFTAAAIHQIQGSGLATPFLGQDVVTSGIVTARKSNGFFLQTPDADVDADAMTSEGLFVFTSAAPAVSAGDFVSVRGTASEFFSLTQLESTLAGDVAVTSSGHALPAAIALTPEILNPAGVVSQMEPYEGMRLQAAALVSVGPTNNFAETYTVLAGVPRPMREPGIEITAPVPPDPSSGVVDCCIPRWDMNPERLVIDSDGLAGAAPISVTSDVTFSNVVGPLDFSFGDYMLLPETPPAVSANLAALPVPAPLPGEFTVAGFNIENFNNADVQRRKAALAIRTVMRYPDVIGHVEIASLAALQALAAQVNADAIAAGDPDPAYEAHLVPFGTSSQHVGFLVKTSRVTIVAVTQERTAETDPTDPGRPLHDRPPLVLRATFGPDARPVVVVVNHLRSFIDVELVDGDGPRVRAKRTAQAESLAGLLQELQVAHPTTPVISVGDYNAFQFNDGYTDPLAIIKGQPTPDEQVVVDESPDLVNPDFINLTDELAPAERYSFVFEGTPQALDHVIVNTVARSHLTRYAIARNNADFPELPLALFADDPDRPERNSDHDMPVAYFDFTAPAIQGLAVTPESLGAPNHKMIDVAVSYTAVDGSGPAVCSLSVASNEPDNGLGDGDTPVDSVVIDANRVKLRAERSGTGHGRTYTVTVTCTDPSGNSSSASAPVTVK